MSCKECDEVQATEGAAKITSYFRWGTANIEVRACELHLKEVYSALRHSQDVKQADALKGLEGGGGVDSKYGDLHIAGVPHNEPVFVLRAQDAHALYLLREYQALVSNHNPGMEEKMELVLRRFKSWRPKKLPD